MEDGRRTIPCDRCGARLEKIYEKCPRCGEEIAGRIDPELRVKIAEELEKPPHSIISLITGLLYFGFMAFPIYFLVSFIMEETVMNESVMAVIFFWIITGLISFVVYSVSYYNSMTRILENKNKRFKIFNWKEDLPVNATVLMFQLNNALFFIIYYFKINQDPGLYLASGAVSLVLVVSGITLHLYNVVKVKLKNTPSALVVWLFLVFILYLAFLPINANILLKNILYAT